MTYTEDEIEAIVARDLPGDQPPVAPTHAELLIALRISQDELKFARTVLERVCERKMRRPTIMNNCIDHNDRLLLRAEVSG